MRTRSSFFACAVLFCAAWLITAAGWDEQHDEGLTCHTAVERLNLADRWNEALPIEALYEHIDGQPAPTLGAMVSELAQGSQLHPPLYYLIANPWMRVAGTGKIALRLPGLLIGLATLLGAARLAQRWVDRPVAAEWLLLLIALSPWFAQITVFLRPYSLGICIGTWATWWALEACGGSRRAWYGLALLSLAGLYTHYYYVFVMAWHGALLAASVTLPGVHPAPRLLALALAAAATALGFLPWLPQVLSRMQGNTNLYYTAGEYSVSEMGAVANSLRLFLVHHGAFLAPAAAALGLVSVVALALGRRERATPPPPGARLAWWTLPVLPLGILAFDLATGNRSLLQTKYAFGLFMPLIVGIVAANTCIRNALMRRIALGAWMALFAVASAAGWRTQLEQPGDFRRIAEQIASEDNRSHLIAFPQVRVGESVSFLRSLRQAGITQARAATGGRQGVSQLSELIEGGLGIRRITYVHIVVPRHYDPRTSGMEELEGVLQAAKARGWKVRRQTGSESLPAPLGPGWISVVFPAKATFFGR